MFRYLKPLRTLRWKLMLTAAVAIFVAVEAVTMINVVQGSIADQRLVEASDVEPALQAKARGLAESLAPILTTSASGPETWLSSRRSVCDYGLSTEVPAPDGRLEWVLLGLSRLAVLSADGELMASAPATDEPTLAAIAPADLRQKLARAVDDGWSEVITVRHDGGNTHVVAPVTDTAGELAGMIYFEAETGPLSASTLLSRAGTMFVEMVPRATPFALLVALLLGALSTRGLVARLRRLTGVAAAWSQGDLTQRVDDSSADELGELARGLNEMALELSTQLDAREELAALEERNHLARELHDTVKQKVFSVSMLLASSELMIESDLSKARACLRDARQAAQQAGKELTGLIEQLRPGPEERAGLTGGVQQFARSWGRVTGIAVELRVGSIGRLPDEVEHSLLRVTQEALANVARHSGARRVRVTCESQAVEPDALALQVTLKVRDDGVGFERTKHAEGGFGLESMASRMEQVGGRLRVESMTGQGTTITAECVVRRNEEPGRGRAA